MEWVLDNFLFSKIILLRFLPLKKLTKKISDPDNLMENTPDSEHYYRCNIISIFNWEN